MLAKQSDSLQSLNRVISETVDDLDRFKKNPADFTRNRKLNAETVLKITLNMQGNSLNAELLDAFPDINDRMTASAYEQAKDKLSPDIFEHVLREYNKTASSYKLLDGKYRVFAIDGSDFTTPYNKNSDFVMTTQSGRPKSNGEPVKPYCQVHANLLYDIRNRTYQDCVLQPKPTANERDAALEMLHRLNAENPYIVIMDRGYDGFNMIENCNRLSNCHYVIRTKVGKGGIREIGALPDAECDIDMVFRVTTSNHYYTQNRKSDPDLHCILHTKKHHKQTFSKNTVDRRWDFEQFCKIRCRVVKFKINSVDSGKEEWEVLLTNLDKSEFPISRMKKLYHERWDIETSFRELKYALGGINFHSKKDDFIKMEESE